MATKPMKTLKLPGLEDTYTFLQNDTTLTQSGKAADAKAAGDAISANSVLQAYRRTVNLFNKAIAVAGYYIDNYGNLHEDAKFETSDFIPIDAGATYAGNFTNHAAWYDAQKSYISRTNTVRIVTAPANAHFLRIDYNTTLIGRDAVMLVQGDVLPAYYVPYLEPRYIGFDSAWRGKTWAAYGDSITAITNGNSLSTGWAKPVNDTLMFSGFYGRGIGSQSFNWGVAGGGACFINADGTYNSRNNNYSKDNYTGEIPAGTTLCRGAFCSWDRITHMFPASIKDTIDLIFIMGGTNDTLTEDELSWIADDTTDPEWAASSYYADYGGDFNISTLRGSIASTIMKFQAWMPNALIVLGTPLNGQTNSAGQRAPGYTPDEYAKSKIIKDVAAELGIPCIDVYAECGVNVLNSPLYITDGTHPNNAAGRNMLARVIASGLAQNRPRY